MSPRPPIYLRGVPQQLREHMRIQFDRAVTLAALDSMFSDNPPDPSTFGGLAQILMPRPRVNPVERDAMTIVASLLHDEPLIMSSYSEDHARKVQARVREILQGGAS